MTGTILGLDSDIGSPVSHPEDKPSSTLKQAALTTSSNDLSPSAADGPIATMLDAANSNGVARGDLAIRRKLSKLLKGKEEEWTAVAQKKGPLQLLDLPIDVLKEIVKEVTHTNDLTALALTHSALHNLAIPHIYSRFDIVWPDATATSDSRTGVDALTYGLATLVMGHDVFGQSPNYNTLDRDNGQLNTIQDGKAVPDINYKGQRRLGNHYPQYTRKFSLGNGPADWVQEYMITKESGKMLGTLVALAVARMVNLETFIWDMPTGVLRDVWLALSSLQYKVPPGECRLERVLVRWHDNSFDQAPSNTISASTPGSVTHAPAGSTVTPVGIMLPLDATPTTPGSHSTIAHNDPATHNRVEYPTLSVLPPLKSLSVLDIDELAYLDEMSVLIEKSKDRLHELRVGISKKAHCRDFVLAWDGPGLQQVDHNAKWPGAVSIIGERRLGGVLGILLGRMFDIRKKNKHATHTKRSATTAATLHPQQPVSAAASPSENDSAGPGINTVESGEHFDGQVSATEGFSHSFVMQSSSQGPPVQSDHDPATNDVEPLVNASTNVELNVSSSIISPAIEISQLDLSQSPLPELGSPIASEKIDFRLTTNDTVPPDQRKHLDGKLKLRTLELERVPLSIAVLQRAFDWSILTSLTILDCAYHESLWRMLRRQFQPQSSHSLSGGSSFARHSLSTSFGSRSTTNAPIEYQLNLKKIHTDVATPALIAFLKETLAPNTLEVLFLQDRRKTTASTVTIDAIYKGPLRRHRKSLKKLLIDSSDKIPRSPALANESTRWRTWMLTHEVLAYITSGNMSSLRELSVAIDYKDLHFFLRRLPQVSTLRSLNIPFIADHVTPSYDPKEIALQVVDMIFLRPEVELCYLGISNKCFEILENRPTEDSQVSEIHATGPPEGTGDHATDEDEDDEGDGSDDEADEDDDDEDDDGTATEAVEAEGVEYDLSDPGDSDMESSDGSIDDRSRVSLRLREILFYDDKVAIFKARHMRL